MSIPILLHGIAAMQAAGLIYALTRAAGILHESGRSISSADLCLTVLFFKLPTIPDPLNFLTSVTLCRIAGQVRDFYSFPTSYNQYYIIIINTIQHNIALMQVWKCILLMILTQ